MNKTLLLCEKYSVIYTQHKCVDKNKPNIMILLQHHKKSNWCLDTNHTACKWILNKHLYAAKKYTSNIFPYYGLSSMGIVPFL